MKFEKINNYLLFGGGVILIQFALMLKKANKKVFVITSDRHSKEIISLDSGDQVFQELLKIENIDFHISDDVNADQKVSDSINRGTLGVSFGAGWVFKGPLIGCFEGRLLNLHGTQLPLNRGGGGFSWQILIGKPGGFCLLHQIDRGIDSGNIVKVSQFSYPEECRTPKEYYDIYEEKTIVFLQEFIEEIDREKEFIVKVQDEDLSTYWPRLSTEHQGYINWSWSLGDIEKFICAFDDPYKGASTFSGNDRVYLKNCSIDYRDGTFHPFQDGMIYRKTKEAVFVAKKEGTLIIRNVMDKSGTDKKGALKVGDRLYTPFKYLEEASQFRAFYTHKGLKIHKKAICDVAHK